MCPVVAAFSALLSSQTPPPPLTVNARATLDITHILEMRSSEEEERKDWGVVEKTQEMGKKDQTDYFSDSETTKMRGRTE